jgi:hypothetical protein
LSAVRHGIGPIDGQPAALTLVAPGRRALATGPAAVVLNGIVMAGAR